MITVALDDSPLRTGHSIRGVGAYTRGLKAALEQLPDQVTLTPLTQPLSPAAEVVHYPTFDLFAPTLPLIKTKPTIVTIHDVIPLLFPEAYPAGKKGSLALAYQKLALKNVQAVITDSQASKADIVKYLGVATHKISVVYLAASADLKKPSPTILEKVTKEWHLPERYVLYVGDINYNKNLPALIKSLKFLPDEIKLVCVGRNFRSQSIPEWQAIETQIALSDVAERIHFITDLKADNQDLLAAVYAQALVYVQPSLAEGFGLPVLEAMQCQTPVIAAHNSSLIEVGGSAALFVEPEAELIAQMVEEVLNWTKDQRAAFVDRAYDWSQTFSWRRTALETVAVYQQCL